MLEFALLNKSVTNTTPTSAQVANLKESQQEEQVGKVVTPTKLSTTIE